MTTLSSDDIKALIISQVGDVTINGVPTTSETDGVIAANIDTLWDLYDGQDVRLQMLYTKRDAIDMVIARVAPQVNTQIGNLQLSKSQFARALGQMRDDVQKRIERMERAIRIANGSGSIGLLETVTPVDPKDKIPFIYNIR